MDSRLRTSGMTASKKTFNEEVKDRVSCKKNEKLTTESTRPNLLSENLPSPLFAKEGHYASL
jgi:hypothetical protein